MDDKNFLLGLSVLGVWIASLLIVVVGTVAMPFLFIYSLFVPEGPEDLINNFVNGLLEGFGIPTDGG